MRSTPPSEGQGLAASGYLALLLGLVAVGMAGTRGAFPHLAKIADTVRDRLTEQVVGGAMRTLATTGRPTGVPVAQLSDQIDQVRSLLTAVLRGVRSTLLPMVGVIVGLCALDAHLAVVALVPLLVALAGYAISLGWLRDRLTRATESEEHFGDQLTSVVTAVPQLRNLGAQDSARTRLAGDVTGVAAASLAAAQMQALRHAVIGCGALLPLIGVLGYGQLTQQLSGGALLGAVTYLLTVLSPALSALV